VITINVTKVPMQTGTFYAGGIESRNFEVVLVEVETQSPPMAIGTLWREEYTDPAHARAFIRGVKAGGMAANVLVHVNQPEWNA
jgi:hypothetical protein